MDEECSMTQLRLMSVLAHPDDESLGLGGVLAKCAAEGVETCLITATRGERGRHGDGGHPGREAVGRMREAELRCAAATLGIKEVHLLDYVDGDLDQADPGEAVGKIVAHIRRFRPQVVVTFGPDGAYGHPDHIAISQFTAAAVVAAADPDYPETVFSHHLVSKLYYMAWTQQKWDAYQSAFRELNIEVEGIRRQAVPWPDWAVTTVVDTESHWGTVWRAVCCHQSQMAVYRRLEDLSPEHHKGLWGSQELYRVFSLVNGGRRPESDLFEGLRGSSSDPAGGNPKNILTGRIVTAYAPGQSLRSPSPAMTPDEFRKSGFALVDRIADFLGSLPDRPVTRPASPSQLRALIGGDEPLPAEGAEPSALLLETAERLFDYSLHNGHPRFWGYITSSAAPIGMLGDLLAAAVNPNVGAWKIAPLASEIECAAIRWIAELLEYPTGCGGLFVSGGNVANMIGLLVARRAKAGWDVRGHGLQAAGAPRLRLYASRETHTWIEKAADISGLGAEAIRWISTDPLQRIDLSDLERRIREDLELGDRSFLVVASAGTVATGAVDPLPEVAEICRRYDLWMHVDGAYGAPAAVVPDAHPDLKGLGLADSLAVDPHKWLYVPLEAGCVLVRDPDLMRDTFSFHPPYYHFDEEATNYFDRGIQNSRGFRALKVWLALRHLGRAGYRHRIGEDIRLAREVYRRLRNHETLEPVTQNLSITTFRYVPRDLRLRSESTEVREYLNELNREILGRIERSGEVFLSNAVVEDRFLLRMCVVNFRTSMEDVAALPEIVARFGREADSELRPRPLQRS